MFLQQGLNQGSQGSFIKGSFWDEVHDSEADMLISRVFPNLAEVPIGKDFPEYLSIVGFLGKQGLVGRKGKA
jgi:hypothetical protein